MILHYPGLKIKELLSKLPKPKAEHLKGSDREHLTKIIWEEEGKTFGIYVRYRSGDSYMTPLSVKMHNEMAYQLDICECTDGCENGQEKLDEKLDIENSWKG